MPSCRQFHTVWLFTVSSVVTNWQAELGPSKLGVSVNVTAAERGVSRSKQRNKERQQKKRKEHDHDPI